MQSLFIKTKDACGAWTFSIATLMVITALLVLPVNASADHIGLDKRDLTTADIKMVEKFFNEKQAERFNHLSDEQRRYFLTHWNRTGLGVSANTINPLLDETERQGTNLQPLTNEQQRELQRATRQARTEQNAPPKEVDVCANISSYSFECLGRVIGFTFATIFMTVGGFFFALAGAVFNFILNETVLEFKKLVDGLGGIDTVWGQLRNIGNIVIIGGLLFVAASTILGVEKYGIRRFVVNILIAAVLINFSLFFTQIIIDASNFTAAQFLRPISAEVRKENTQQENTRASQVLEGTKSVSIFEPEGVAGKFYEFMGIQSLWNTSPVLTEVAQGGGFRVLVYGLVAFIFFTSAAAVLFYGSYLLVVRAISLIMLMITSALAFGTYSFPLARNIWWWWWKLLLVNALFAPVLAIMLWATIFISASLASAGGKSANLNGLLTNPAGAMGSVFNFVIVLGLLYASFWAARSLSLTGANAFPGVNKVSAYIGKNAIPSALGGLGFAKWGALSLLRLRTASATASGQAQQGGRYPGFARPTTQTAGYADAGVGQTQRRLQEGAFAQIPQAAGIASTFGGQAPPQQGAADGQGQTIDLDSIQLGLGERALREAGARPAKQNEDAAGAGARGGQQDAPESRAEKQQRETPRPTTALPLETSGATSDGRSETPSADAQEKTKRIAAEKERQNIEQAQVDTVQRSRDRRPRGVSIIDRRDHRDPAGDREAHGVPSTKARFPARDLRDFLSRRDIAQDLSEKPKPGEPRLSLKDIVVSGKSENKATEDAEQENEISSDNPPKEEASDATKALQGHLEKEAEAEALKKNGEVGRVANSESESARAADTIENKKAA